MKLFKKVCLFETGVRHLKGVILLRSFSVRLLSIVLCSFFILTFAASSFPLFLSARSEDFSSEGKEALLSMIYEADIPTLHKMLSEGYITCRELTEFYLERIEAYNDTYNCFITLCPDVLDEADKKDELIASGEDFGLMYGIPIVIKDNIDLSGYVTSNGESLSRESASEDAAAVSLLREAGAVIIGKTNMSTSAQMARYTISAVSGETVNAYSPELSAGGSSGGTAVAVSLNFAAAGLGTDTNSSLRYPAALNGDVSLRSTFSLVDTSGTIILNGVRDVVGAITRSVVDQAIMLDVLTGGEHSYFKNLDGEFLSGVRVGVLRELSSESSLTDDEVLKAFDRAVEELGSLGATIVEVSFPEIFDLSSACSENLEGYEEAKEIFYSEFKNFLSENGVSVVVFPTYLSTPNSSGFSEDNTPVADSETYINNCSYISPVLGTPEISLPIGYHSRGAGIGMEIASLRGEEQTLLNIAYSYELSTEHRESPSGAENLHKNENGLTIENFDNGSDSGFFSGWGRGEVSLFSMKAVPAVILVILPAVILLINYKYKSRKKKKRRE